MSDHGFMSMACSLLNEQGWNWNAIERQLDHEERNNARAAHDYVQLMPERKKMVLAWADYPDGNKARAKIMPIRSARASRQVG